MTDPVLPADERSDATTALTRAKGTAKLMALPFYVYEGVARYLDNDVFMQYVQPISPLGALWAALEFAIDAALNSGDVQQLLVRNFMRMADQATPESPTLADEATQQLRLRLIREECDELELAYQARSLPDVMDAVADLLYVVHGTSVAHGFEDHPVVLLVHENNMLKFERGHKDDGGKWVKPVDHQPPDIAGELVRQYRLTAPRASGLAVNCECGNLNSAHAHDAPPFEWLTVLCDQRRVKL